MAPFFADGIVENASSDAEEQTQQTKSTRKESAARSIGDFGPGMNGWQNEIQVKITLDARSIAKKKPYQTEVMMLDMVLFKFFNSHPDIQEAQQGHLDGRLAIRRDSILDQARTAKDLEDIALDVFRPARYPPD